MRQNLTKKDIVNSVYMQLGYSKKISEILIEDFFDLIIDELIKNKIVKISKFGTFMIKSKNERIGRNPKTREIASISRRNVISFKASKELKAYINKND